MYRFMRAAGNVVEVCDECGFNGAQVDSGDVSRRLGEVRRAWAEVVVMEEDLLRARPAPATWCVVEYGEHTAFALAAIEWAAREFVQGRAPEWSNFPGEPLDDATADNHNCATSGIHQTVQAIEQATLSLASYAESLGETDLQTTEDYGGGLIITTGAVIRHALHDAEHHVLDIRRGIARMLLAL